MTRWTVLESADTVAVLPWFVITADGPAKVNCKLLDCSENDTLDGYEPLLPSNVRPVLVVVPGPPLPPELVVPDPLPVF